MRKRKVTKRVMFNGKRLSRTKKRNKGFDLDLLGKIERFHDYVHWKYSKAFYVRLDVTYPLGTVDSDSYEDDNVIFRNFIDVFRRQYTRNKTRTDYFWVRERSKTGCHHFHLMFILDGNIIQHGYPIFERARDLWAKALRIENAGGLIHLVRDKVDFKYGGSKVIRKSATEYHYDQIFERFSYLGKVHSKNTPKGINEYGHSRLRIPDGVETNVGTVDPVTGEIFWG